MTAKKLLFMTFGVINIGIALAGVWLPGIPTTFPLIVALWAFGKSSPKLYMWARGLPVLKQALIEVERFERERAIDWRIKLIAIASAWLSTIVVALFSHNLVISSLVAASALACTTFMVCMPTHRARRAEPTTDLD